MKEKIRNRGQREIMRQWQILTYLAAQRFPKSRVEIAEHFEGEWSVNPRTVARDLADLELAGFPIQRTRDEKTLRYAVPRTLQAPLSVPLTLDELAALHTARAHLRGVALGDGGAALTTAFDKLIAAVPASVRHMSEQVSALVIRQVRGRPKVGPASETLASLRRAIISQRVCRIDYRRRGEQKVVVRRYAPQRMLTYRDSLYCVCWSLNDRGYRTVACERILGIHVLAETLTARPAREIDRHYASAFGLFTGTPFSLRLRFAPSLVAYVEEREWHPSESTERQSDGSLLYRAEVSGEREVKAWVLGFGCQVVVDEPDWLRAEVAAEAEKIAAFYRRA